MKHHVRLAVSSLGLFLVLFCNTVHADRVNLPSIVSSALREEYGISEIEGFLQCIQHINYVLSEYQTCVDSGRNIRCENIAAWQIAKNVCKAYCDCGV